MRDWCLVLFRFVQTSQVYKYFSILFAVSLFPALPGNKEFAFFPELIPYEDIIKELEADTLDNGAALGIGGSKFSCGRFSQVAALELKVRNGTWYIEA